LGEATQGECVDGSGDVFVPAWTPEQSVQSYIYEFAHGGTKPIQILTDGTVLNTSCAIDPTTGDLAVTYFRGVAIFPNAQGTPTFYSVPNYGAQWSAYDPDGDLFVSNGKVAVLPKGENQFASVTFNESVDAASIQWNDGYLTMVGYHGNPAKYEPVYRAQLSGTNGIIVGTTNLKTRKWAYDGNGQVWIQDKKIMGAGTHHLNLNVWRYPQGGNATKIAVKHFTPWGVVVSHAPSHSRGRQ